MKSSLAFESLYPAVIGSAFAAVSAFYIWAVWSVAYEQLGIVRAPNPMLLYLAAVAGGGMLWLASIGALALAIGAAVRRRYVHCVVFVLSAALTVASPLVARARIADVVRQAALRDAQRVGVAALRTEASALLAAHKAKPYRSSLFGGFVPREDLPPAIRTLSARAACVEVADEGVVVVTDGMGGWRGGYMIMPTGSPYVPFASRQITDGVYYVVSK